jgi:hypothetical protein
VFDPHHDFQLEYAFESPGNRASATSGADQVIMVDRA